MFTKKDHLNTESRIVISVTLVGDKEIQELNKKYKKKDEVTDVLSFVTEQQYDSEYVLGDIIVNKDQANRQSGEYGNTVEEEIAELVEHGVLHLLGVHHGGDEH